MGWGGIMTQLMKRSPRSMICTAGAASDVTNFNFTEKTWCALIEAGSMMGKCASQECIEVRARCHPFPPVLYQLRFGSFYVCFSRRLSFLWTQKINKMYYSTYISSGWLVVENTRTVKVACRVNLLVQYRPFYAQFESIQF